MQHASPHLVGALPRRHPPRLRRIALVGVDGSGKTTQARRLVRELRMQGVPAAYRRNAGGRRSLDRLARALDRRDASELLGVRGLLLAESVLRWLALARATSVRGRTVTVLDRYSACQYVSLRVRARSARGGAPRGERLTRLAYSLFPRPDVTFLLVIDPVEAQRRIEARHTDHETLAYLTAASAAYLDLPERDSFVIVDAAGTPDEVAERIRGHLPPWPAPAPSAPPDAEPSPARPVRATAARR